MGDYINALTSNSYDVLIDEAEKAKESYTAGIEKFQGMIKPRRARMDQSIRLQLRMSEKLAFHARTILDEAKKCREQAEIGVAKVFAKRALEIFVTMVQMATEIALTLIPVGRVSSNMTLKFDYNSHFPLSNLASKKSGSQWNWDTAKEFAIMIADAWPGVYPHYVKFFLQDIPEMNYILDSAGKAMKVGGMAVDISSSIAKDLSKISDDFFETLQILFKFQTTYEDIFESKLSIILETK